MLAPSPTALHSFSFPSTVSLNLLAAWLQLLFACPLYASGKRTQIGTDVFKCSACSWSTPSPALPPPPLLLHRSCSKVLLLQRKRAATGHKFGSPASVLSATDAGRQAATTSWARPPWSSTSSSSCFQLGRKRRPPRTPQPMEVAERENREAGRFKIDFLGC